MTTREVSNGWAEHKLWVVESIKDLKSHVVRVEAALWGLLVMVLGLVGKALFDLSR